MTETTTPQTPSPTTPGNNTKVTVGKPETPQSVFVSMALDMSWRLAVVVLVPIVGGFEIDSHVGTTPLLTVIGFLVAIAGVFIVMRQTVKAANVATGKNAPAAQVVPPQGSGEEKRP